MQQITSYGDERNQGRCVYCGGQPETRDHVPSRVLLDSPLPENLPVVRACEACNGSFSRDEEYLACAIECALTGSVEAAAGRARIGAILAHSPALASKLRAVRYERDGEIGFDVELNRVRAVVLKLARGHAAYELNEPQFEEPTGLAIMPFTAMSVEQREVFESLAVQPFFAPSPEVGSRAMERLFLGKDMDERLWATVQPGQYRYRVDWSGGVRVQVVIREYLAADVWWD